MIHGIDPSAEVFLLSLEQIRERAERAGREIASGRRVASASDDPDHVPELLEARTRLGQISQVGMNLGRAKAEVDTAEQAIATAVQALERAIQAGVRGVTSTASAESRRVLAVEVAGILEEIVSIASTQVEGQYVFAGDAGHAEPYRLDLAQPAGVSAYAGSASTRDVLHPAGSTIRIARTAQEIFDDPDHGAFAALNNLRVALETGPLAHPGDPGYETAQAAQTAAIEAALSDVRSAREHVSTELAAYGGIQNRIHEAIEFGAKLDVRQQAALSELQDSDVTASTLALKQALHHTEIALSARAQLPRSSLFDYLG
jgi:flagellar hook-associated protein 3 FlgL